MINLKLLALLLVGGVTYQVVLKDDTGAAELEAALTQQASADFISIAGTIQKGNEILIFAPINCPKEEAQQALYLQSELNSQGFNAVLTNNINVVFNAQSQLELDQQMQRHGERMNVLMGQNGPYVFIRNQGKANPTLDEIVTAYRTI